MIETSETKTPSQRALYPFFAEEEIDCEDCGGRGYDLGGLNPTEYEPCSVCGGTCKQLVQRNYLGEAFQIAQGQSHTLPERKHLVAIIAFARQFVSAALNFPDVAA